MNQRRQAHLLVLSRKQRRTKPPGIIWSSAKVRISGGCLRVMERTNASFRSANLTRSLLYFETNTLTDRIRHAIHISWQLRICLMFEDMQRRIYLLGIRLKTTFGSCKISSLVSCKKLIICLIISVRRIGDVVIHSSGEKTVPAAIEEVVMSSP